MELEIDRKTIEEFEKLINDQEFIHFILGNTTDIKVSMWILQICFDEIRKAKAAIEEAEAEEEKEGE